MKVGPTSEEDLERIIREGGRKRRDLWQAQGASRQIRGPDPQRVSDDSAAGIWFQPAGTAA